MTPQQSLEVLKQFQDWRTNKRDDYDYSPQDLTQALNIAIEVMEKRRKEIIEAFNGGWFACVNRDDPHSFPIQDGLSYFNSLNLDKPEHVATPYVIPKHTIPIERIEEIIISTAPAPAKLNQIANLMEKYKAK